MGHYDPRKVERLYALEPNPGMVALAEARWRRTRPDTRDIPSSIASAGFEMEQVERTYLSPFPKSSTHCC
jgi:hypothetical protein